MIITLLWLTVSTPYVYAAQQLQEKHALTSSPSDDNPCDSEETNPFANTTEEKAPSTSINSFSEEYLHHNEDLFHCAELLLSHKKDHTATEYTAFHGELLCPPPNSIH